LSNLEGIFNYNMSKIIAIGDIHGSPLWKEIVIRHKDEDCIFVFMADYFDSYDYSTVEQLYNFNEIIEFKKANPEKVILLIGNHDWEYFPEKQDKGLMSGFQGRAAVINIGYILNINREFLQAAFSYNNLLFSHAGISIDWMKLIVEHTPMDLPDEYNAYEIAAFTNYIFQYKPNFFNFISGGDKYGNDFYQSPFWIRPKALMRNCKDIRKNLIQIVGHTKQNQIDIKGKATSSRYFFIDTLNSNNEYLVIENNQFTSKII